MRALASAGSASAAISPDSSSGSTAYNSATKKHFDHFSIEHRQINCDHLPFKSGKTNFICPHHYCNPRRPPEGSPFFHSGALRQVWPVCSSARPPLQRCQIVPSGASRIGPHRCFSRHQETLRSMCIRAASALCTALPNSC